jgi:hypothetical protein
MAGTPALGILLAAALARQEAPPTGAAPPAASTVTIRGSPAPAGTGIKVVSTVTTELHGAFTVGGAKLRDIERTIEDRRAFEVTIAGGDGGTRSARVAYGECISRLTDPTGVDRIELPTSNVHYVVPAGPEPQVRELDAQGEPQPGATRADVATQVAFDAGELLNGARLGPTLAGKPLEVGKELKLGEDAARDLLAGTLEGVAVTRFALTPKPAAEGSDRVVFAAALVVTTKQGEELAVESTFELAGEITLGREHGRVVSLELSGPIRYGGSRDDKGTKIEVRGTGTLTWTYRAEPLPSK